jgi:hypothetical protein
MKQIIPLTQQNKFLNVISLYILRYYFFIAGYRSGKSFTICLMILMLAKKYEGQNVTIGLGSPTISLMRKTFIKELEIILISNKIDYTYNKQDNIIMIGGVTFQMVATGYPSDIYGYTFNAFLCDEIDELPQHYGQDCFTAIDERCSQAFPDGRPPFCCFFTTAQGFKTAYVITRDLKSKNIPYALVRGKTIDNIHNDPSYYENRYKLYNENERLCYLEGYFVNLTTGKCYPDFDEEKATVEPFEILTNDTILVGQDKNIGYNKATAWVKRNKILYLVKSFSFKSISDAPRILRATFPENDIYWYPDATAAELLAGYANEIKSYNIQLRVGSINPSRLARLFMMNKLFKTDRARVFKGNDEFCIALKTRCFDNNGMPEKGKGENAPDHWTDCADYIIFRIVMQDQDFADIRDATQKVK